MPPDDEQKPKAFVIMPFDAEFEAIYEQLIKPALEEAGYWVGRADSFLDQQNILATVIRSIASADLVVAELTTLNANVMYEVGISHTLGRPTILLTQSISDLPFDLRSYSTQEYSVNFVEALKLKSTLQRIGQQCRKGEISFSNPVSDYLPGAPPQAATRTQPAQSSKTDERGFLDFATDLESSAQRVILLLGKITGEATTNAADLQEHTSRINTLKDNPGPGSLAQFQRIAQLAAYDINEYCTRLESLHTEFDQATDELIGVAEWQLNWFRQHANQNDPNVATLRNTLDQFSTMSKAAVATTIEYRDALDSATGISRDLTRATGRLRKVLTSLISSYQKLEAFGTRASSLFNA
ncbi:MAG: hypothetical protein ABSF64_20490 [Bryobacteraceae bacterium]